MLIIQEIKDKFNLLKIMLKQKKRNKKLLDSNTKLILELSNTQQELDKLKTIHIITKSNNDRLEQDNIKLELGIKNLTTYNNKLLNSLEKYRKDNYENGTNAKS